MVRLPEQQHAALRHADLCLAHGDPVLRLWPHQVPGADELLFVGYPPDLPDQVGRQGRVVHLGGEGLPVHAAHAGPLLCEKRPAPPGPRPGDGGPVRLPGVSVHVGGHGHIAQRDAGLVQLPLHPPDHQLELVVRRRPHGVHLLLLSLHGQAVGRGPVLQPCDPLVGVVQAQQQVPLGEVGVEEARQGFLRAVLVLRLLPGGVPQPALRSRGASTGDEKLRLFSHVARLIRPGRSSSHPWCCPLSLLYSE